MRLGYSTALHPEPLTTACARIAGHGYDGVELLVDDATLASPLEIRAVLDAHGRELAAGAVVMTPERKMINPEPAVRGAAAAHLVAAVEFVAALGGGVVTISPGTEGTPRATCGRAAGEVVVHQRVGCRPGSRRSLRCPHRDRARVPIRDIRR